MFLKGKVFVFCTTTPTEPEQCLTHSRYSILAEWINLYISYKYHSAKSRDSFLTTLEVEWKKETTTLALILRTPFPYSLPSNSQNQGSRQADKWRRLFQKWRFRGSKHDCIFWGIRIILTSLCLDHNGYWQKG